MRLDWWQCTVVFQSSWIKAKWAIIDQLVCAICHSNRSVRNDAARCDLAEEYPTAIFVYNLPANIVHVHVDWQTYDQTLSDDKYESWHGLYSREVDVVQMRMPHLSPHTHYFPVEVNHVNFHVWFIVSIYIQCTITINCTLLLIPAVGIFSQSHLAAVYIQILLWTGSFCLIHTMWNTTVALSSIQPHKNTVMYQRESNAQLHVFTNHTYILPHSCNYM